MMKVKAERNIYLRVWSRNSFLSFTERSGKLDITTFKIMDITFSGSLEKSNTYLRNNKNENN